MKSEHLKPLAMCYWQLYVSPSPSLGCSNPFQPRYTCLRRTRDRAAQAIPKDQRKFLWKKSSSHCRDSFCPEWFIS